MKITFWFNFDFRSLGLGVVFRLGSLHYAEASAIIGPLAMHLSIKVEQ